VLLKHPSQQEALLQQQTFAECTSFCTLLLIACEMNNMESELPRKRSSSIGPKLTLKEVVANPLLTPQPPPHLSKDLQKEWNKAQVAMRNLNMDGMGTGDSMGSQLPELEAPKAKAGAKISSGGSGKAASLWKLFRPSAWCCKGAGSLTALVFVAALVSGCVRRVWACCSGCEANWLGCHAD